MISLKDVQIGSNVNYEFFTNVTVSEITPTEVTMKDRRGTGKDRFSATIFKACYLN